MKRAFDKIAAGLNDAIAYAEGDTARGRETKPIDVRAIRLSMNLTQSEFAKRYRLPIGTVRDWEQRRSQPDSGSKIYLRMIEAEPARVLKIVEKVVS
ncbi:MAG TPA: helix-turn-helix domain-containing protein [Allosphingosinicella sp.]